MARFDLIDEMNIEKKGIDVITKIEENFNIKMIMEMCLYLKQGKPETKLCLIILDCNKYS